VAPDSLLLIIAVRAGQDYNLGASRGFEPTKAERNLYSKKVAEVG
jgi:hypothetical protein